jgi:citrate synthase
LYILKGSDEFMKKSVYLSAEEAANTLQIQKDTLYAYVSRGRLRSVEVPNQKARGYLREDIEQLQQRKRLRQHPTQEVQQALHWGMPLVRSNVSHLNEGQLFYRHQSLPTVAQHSTLEQLISLLWQAPEVESALYWQKLDTTLSKSPSKSLPQAKAVTPTAQLLSHLPADISWFHQMQISLSVWTVQDLSASLPSAMISASTCAKLLLRIWGSVHSYVFKSPTPSITHGLQDFFRSFLPDALQQDLAIKLIILAAEHELNLSSFTARCVASGNGNLYQSLMAAFAALGTPRHGGQVLQVQHLLKRTQGKSAHQALQETLQSGAKIPMPGHPLYPEGDPRWHYFVDYLKTYWPHHPAARHGLELAALASESQGEWPTLDWVLGIGAELLCPAHLNALDWFALARTVGWLAHIQEQAHQAEMIRPRGHWEPAEGDY